MLILPALTLDEDEAAAQGGIDVPAASQDDTTLSKAHDTVKQETLVTEDNDYIVSVKYDVGANIPQSTKLTVNEITEKSDSSYKDYESKALEAVCDKVGSDKVSGFDFAKFYDITLESQGKETQPDSSVDVTIDFNKKSALNGDGTAFIVHFKENPKTGKITASVLDEEDTQFTIKNDKMQQASFAADSFSVYAVVYTVDFYYGEYEYHMNGGEDMLLSELFGALGIDVAASDVSSVKFSDSDLLEITKTKSDYKLSSLKPFDTEELLTITMENGDVYEVKVTDAVAVKYEVTDASLAQIHQSGSTDVTNKFANTSSENTS
ncbi:MAG: hypothetical protein IJV66_05115, partial [Firmicutes bacterium]|nr:hypothetical protein [Bacillota bacterium]